MDNSIVAGSIYSLIKVIRSQKVILDYDIASLYGIETKALKQAVKRNMERFPGDFMFQLTKQEYQSLRSQIVTLKRGEHSKYLPYAFTEQGVAMLSSVLRSKKAIEINIYIMRAFVQLRNEVVNYDKLASQIKSIKAKTKKHDLQIDLILEAINQMSNYDESEQTETIGFKIN